MKNWERALLLKNSTIKQAIVNLKKSAMQIVLVVNKKKELKGVLTDGDLRNIILNKKNLNTKIDKFINKKPFILKQETNHKAVEEFMIKKKVLQIPLVKKKRVVGLYVWSHLYKEQIKENIFLIMAGGMGKRMIPYSNYLPKPMLKVDNKPIIEHIILQAKKFGFIKFYISINYLGNKIVKFLGNGRKYKVKIFYIKEKKPLGTAGCLYYLKNKTNRPILVSNGDIVSDINFSEFTYY
jgi:hypothetical protein